MLSLGISLKVPDVTRRPPALGALAPETVIAPSTMIRGA